MSPTISLPGLGARQTDIPKNHIPVPNSGNRGHVTDGLKTVSAPCSHRYRLIVGSAMYFIGGLGHFLLPDTFARSRLRASMRFAETPRLGLWERSQSYFVRSIVKGRRFG